MQIVGIEGTGPLPLEMTWVTKKKKTAPAKSAAVKKAPAKKAPAKKK